MSDIDVLDQMIAPAAKIQPLDKYNRKMAELMESRCPGSAVSIYGLPDKVVIIRADAFRSTEAFFAGSQGECKRADFIIAAELSNKKILLCIEMKKTKGSLNEIVRQLKGAQCLGLYCKEIGRKFWNRHNFLSDFEFRFISIGHTSIAKRKTRIDRNGSVHSHPENMMKIDWPHRLEFKKIV